MSCIRIGHPYIAPSGPDKGRLKYAICVETPTCSGTCVSDQGICTQFCAQYVMHARLQCPPDLEACCQHIATIPMSLRPNNDVWGCRWNNLEAIPVGGPCGFTSEVRAFAAEIRVPNNPTALGRQLSIDLTVTTGPAQFITRSGMWDALFDWETCFPPSFPAGEWDLADASPAVGDGVFIVEPA